MNGEKWFSKGVKVADVAWGSKAFFEKNGFDTPYRAAPELCVEIISRSNIDKEIDEKINLYLTQGAHEVWICNEHGIIRFYTVQGETAGSRLFPAAPGKIEW